MSVILVRRCLYKVHKVFIGKSLVFKPLHGVKDRKSLGPDGIGGRVLRNCDMQLADISYLIFQWSLKLHKVPFLRKDSVIVPVPKIQNPKTADDFRPVALMCFIMKTSEKVVKNALLNPVQDKSDPLQFTYYPSSGG